MMICLSNVPICPSDYTEKIKVNAENGFHLALLWFEFQIETTPCFFYTFLFTLQTECLSAPGGDKMSEIQAGHFVCTVTVD